MGLVLTQNCLLIEAHASDPLNVVSCRNPL
jgi:hypothetical protein